MQKSYPKIFPTKEEARQLYGLKEDENLILEINIGGPHEKAYILTEMLASDLQKILNAHKRVRIVNAIDPQTREIIPDRLAVIAGPIKVAEQTSVH